FAENEDSNSFHLSLDGGEEIIWDLPIGSMDGEDRHWSWLPVNRRLDDDRSIDPLVFDLAPGSHELQVRFREDGAHLDALLITNDLDNRPDGLWPGVLPEVPVRLEMEAESARLT